MFLHQQLHTSHPLPLPSGERGRVRDLMVKMLNAFVLVKVEQKQGQYFESSIYLFPHFQ
jgi:hypothetical protein